MIIVPVASSTPFLGIPLSGWRRADVRRGWKTRPVGASTFGV